MAKNYKKSIFSSALVMGSATFVSRILGFIRDMVIAFFLGSSNVSDAFFVAFRIPNLLRRLFGEGSLTASFIPIFTKYKINYGNDEANKIASISFSLLFLILTFITFLGIYFSPEIVKVIAPGFEKSYYKFTLTVKLNRIMFSYIFFISFVALCMGILNSYKHFFAPSIAPALLNISIISGAIFAFFFKKNIAFGLAYGVVIGGILQLVLQLIYLNRFNIKISPCFQLNHPAIKEILLLMGPSAIGLAITQINIFIGTLLASLLPDGSISYLYYADRLIQFPLGIFAVSIGSAILPLLSEQHAKQNLEDMRASFMFGIKLIFLISIPSMIGLIFAGKPIISLLFQRGVFDYNALNNVFKAIVGYSIGLWAYASLRVIVPVYYAFKDTKTPVKAGFVALILNIFFSIILMKYFLHTGLAIATSLSSIFNFLFLLFFLNKYVAINFNEIFNYILKLFVPSICLIIFLIIFQKIFIFNYSYNLLYKFFYVFVLILLSILSYIILCNIFRIEEIKFLTRKLKS